MVAQLVSARLAAAVSHGWLRRLVFEFLLTRVVEFPSDGATPIRESLPLFERSGRSDRVSDLRYFRVLYSFRSSLVSLRPPHFYGFFRLVVLVGNWLFPGCWLCFSSRLTLSDLSEESFCFSLDCFSLCDSRCPLCSGSLLPSLLAFSHPAHVVRWRWSSRVCPSRLTLSVLGSLPAHVVRFGWVPDGCFHAPRGETFGSWYSGSVSIRRLSFLVVVFLFLGCVVVPGWNVVPMPVVTTTGASCS
jgi:hypothetical protein